MCIRKVHGGTANEECVDNVDSMLRDGEVKRAAASSVLRVRVCAKLQQQINQFWALVNHGVHERSSLVTIQLIDRLASFHASTKLLGVPGEYKRDQ